MVSDSPFLRASRAFIVFLDGMATTDEQRAAAPGEDRPATVAEVASCRDTVNSMRLRFGGMLLRALEGELAIGNATPAIRRHARALADTSATWTDEASRQGSEQIIPIGDLVAIQYGAILLGAAHA